MKYFVYGTLKSGYGNNRLLSSGTFVGKAFVDGYKLYDSGFPVATSCEKSTVVGEVWEVRDEDSRTQSNLDALEGFPYMYGRDKVTAKVVQMTPGSLDVFDHECQMYVGNPNSWDFNRMKECPVNGNGQYEWSRVR